MVKSGSPAFTGLPTKSTKTCFTKPETRTATWCTRVSSTATRPTVRQLPPTGPFSTLAVRSPMSCCRSGSMVTAASPFTSAPLAPPPPFTSSS